MPDSIPQTSFSELLSSNTPLLDVRAPIEFIRGSLPNSFNIPLLDDQQRQSVGTVYREQGKDKAIALGHKLIGPEKKAARLKQWQTLIERNPGCVLYCFRGGQRSQITQSWLQESGHDIRRIEGGFKAVRQFLIDKLREVAENQELIIAAGKTGCGKTHLINGLRSSVDLEGRANHRGSAFGRRVSPQPSQIDFENTLAVDFLKLPANGKIFIEDESHSIGSIHLPPVLYEKMKKSPLAIIEATVEERTSVIFNDYIHDNYLDYIESDSARGFENFSQSLLSSLERIQRRLGGELYKSMKDIMTSALQSHLNSGDPTKHREWIGQLLSHYYDPMYDYQLSKKSDRIVFRGNGEEFIAWAKHIDSSKS